MDRRAIRITVELPDDLFGRTDVDVGEGGVTGATGNPSVSSTAGEARFASEVQPANVAADGDAIDGGAPPFDLVHALGSEPGIASYGTFGGTEDGAGTTGAGATGAGTSGGMAMDAGPLAPDVAAMLDASGPRHPLAGASEFRPVMMATEVIGNRN